jgi:hypothetical protein
VPAACLYLCLRVRSTAHWLFELKVWSGLQCTGHHSRRVPPQVKGKGLLTRLIFGLAFRWKQLRIQMGAAVESVSTVFPILSKSFSNHS